MHEDVSPTDLPTVVVHYPRTGHPSMMIGRVRVWRVRRGMVVEELLEVRDTVESEEEINKTEIVNVWRPGTPIYPTRMPVVPLRLRLFGHHHHYLEANTQASAFQVHARRPTLAQMESRRPRKTPWAWYSPCDHIFRTPVDPAPAPPAAMAVAGHAHDRRVDTENTACARVPPPPSGRRSPPQSVPPPPPFARPTTSPRGLTPPNCTRDCTCGTPSFGCNCRY